MPLPTIRPASMTTIRSAFMIVPTRWATMISVAPPSSALERRAQPRVRAEVERREAVVEDVDLGLLDQRPGDRQALALAARQVRAALGDRRLEAALHLLDEVARLGDLERVPQLVVGRRWIAEAQVARDRAAEQERLLGDDAERAPEVWTGRRSRTSTPSTRTVPVVAS